MLNLTEEKQNQKERDETHATEFQEYVYSHKSDEGKLKL